MSIFLLWSFGLFIFFFFFFFLAMNLLLTGNIYLYEYELFSGVSNGGFILIFDWLGVMFFSVVLFISTMVFIYSDSYMEGDLMSTRFVYLVLLFILSMGLLVLSPNLMSLLLGWDGLGLISYGLVIYYQNIRSYNAGFLTVLSNRLGDVGILLGIVALVNFGHWNIIFFDFFICDFLSQWLFWCIILAAMTKSAQLPFSSWLPAAMAAPTPVSSLVHSSTLVTAGVFLLIRFHDIFFYNLFGNWMMLISLMTLLMSGVGACLEMDFKKVIALSTLSQLALMMFSLSLGMWEMAYFHMLTHAIFKALLFLCAGSLIHSMGGLQDMRMLGGILNFSPTLGCGMLVSFLSLGGIPFSCGFYSKDLIIELFLMGDKNLFYFLMFFFGVFSTIIYSYRLVYNLLMKSFGGGNFYSYSETPLMNFSIFLLSVCGVFFGGLMGWVLFDFSNLIILPFYLKLFTLSGTLLVFWYFFSIYLFFPFFLKLKIRLMGCFFISMWFLSFLGGFLFSFFNMVFSLFLVKGEFSWGEMFGGKGLSLLLIKGMDKIQIMQYNILFFQIILILGFLIFLIFFG